MLILVCVSPSVLMALQHASYGGCWIGLFCRSVGHDDWLTQCDTVEDRTGTDIARHTDTQTHRHRHMHTHRHTNGTRRLC